MYLAGRPARTPNAKSGCAVACLESRTIKKSGGDFDVTHYVSCFNRYRNPDADHLCGNK